MTSPSETENSAGTAPPAKAEKPAETPVTQETAASPTSDATTTAASAPANKPSVHKTDYEKDVVYLYQFTRCPTLPGISPFCLKVETWLRMTQVKYEVSSSSQRAVCFKSAHCRDCVGRLGVTRC